MSFLDKRSEADSKPNELNQPGNEETGVELLVKEVQGFQEELAASMQKELDNPNEIGRDEFILLLGGISACRKMPGIHEHMGYQELYLCESEEDIQLGREHLKKVYNITDRSSLEEMCRSYYHAGQDYDQFMSFWEGQPAFDVKELNSAGREAFEKCKGFAEEFRPFVGEGGFFAWDCNERLGLLRKACACGLITEEEFWSMSEPLARHASARYASWGEYAMSCLCGAAYFMYCESCFEAEEAHSFVLINRNLLSHLFSDGGAWMRSGWFLFPQKKWALSAEEIKPLLNGWEEAEGCLATDRILVDGCKVGYMYREEPDENGMPDSGWRFFAGDESDEYANNPDNVGIYHLNTLCNYDPDILPLLHAPFGTAFIRDEAGEFQEEEFIAPTE